MSNSQSEQLQIEKIQLDEATELTATRLMWAGLIPFIGTAIIGAIGFWQAPLAQAFLIYSAVILSFLGGIHWGLIMAKGMENPQGSLVICMIPSIIGWLSVAFLPVLWALGVLAIVYMLWLKYDVKRVGQAWYEKVRQPVTFVVAGCHFLWFITIATELRVG